MRKAAVPVTLGVAKHPKREEATTLFEIERHSPGDGKQALMYAREKRRASARRAQKAAAAS